MKQRPTRKERSTSSTSASLLGARGVRRMSRRVLTQIGAAVVLIALIGAIGVSLAHKNADRTAAHDAATGPTPRAARGDGSIRIGPADAKAVVQATEDFQCPSCKKFEATSSATLADLAKGPAAVDYRPVAILDRMSSTDYSTRAASAAYCVADADITKWPAWHSAMFAQQPPEGAAGLPDSKIVDIARSVGVTGGDVAQCITSHRFEKYVATITHRATAEGLQHTPTVRIDGREIDNPTPDALRAAVAHVKK